MSIRDSPGHYPKHITLEEAIQLAIRLDQHLRERLSEKMAFYNPSDLTVSLPQVVPQQPNSVLEGTHVDRTALNLHAEKYIN